MSNELTPEESAMMQDQEEAEVVKAEESYAPVEQAETAQEAPADTPEVAEQAHAAAPAEAKETESEDTEKSGNLLAALHEARSKIKELNERLGVVDQLKEQLDALRKAEQPKPVEFEEDPLGYTKDALATHQERMARLEAEQAHRAIVDSVRSLEDQFTQEHPDYDDAAVYLRDFRIKELELLGVTDPNQVRASLYQSAQWVVNQAMAQGKNPAELLYATAKQYGYKGKEPAKEAPKQDAELATIQKGMATAKSLSGGGEATPGELSVEEALKLPAKEFDAWWAKNMKGKG